MFLKRRLSAHLAFVKPSSPPYTSKVGRTNNLTQQEDHKEYESKLHVDMFFLFPFKLSSTMDILASVFYQQIESHNTESLCLAYTSVRIAEEA